MRSELVTGFIIIGGLHHLGSTTIRGEKEDKSRKVEDVVRNGLVTRFIIIEVDNTWDSKII